MTPHISYITLNNQRITVPELTKLSSGKILNPETPEWEMELYLFLNEWFSETDFVTAQTSGSTGEPKQIELSKSVMLKSAERTINYFGLQENSRVLLNLPCRYIAGKMMVVRAVVGRMNLFTVDPATTFDFLDHKSFDFGAMVPNQIIKIRKHPSGLEKLQNIRNLLIGGSGISSELENQISQLSTRVVLTYGMTETASHIAIRELTGSLESDTYQCLQGISVGLTESGCLRIFHPDFKEPLLTNDLAEVLSETRFRILGRSDFVIISGGIKYSPEILEKKLEGKINTRYIISSIPDEKLGEKLVLVIEGESGSPEHIRQSIKNSLTPYEQPKIIHFTDKFPESSTGKILRTEIKNLLLTRNII